MTSRIIVILSALALVSACDKGGKKKEGKTPVVVKSGGESAPTAQPSAQPAKRAKAATGSPARKARAGTKTPDTVRVDARGLKNVRVERVNKRKVPSALRARNKRRKARPPKAPKAPKVNPVVAAKAAKIALPGKGSKSAKVELIEVSDFQCPYCRKVKPTIKKLLAKYGGDLTVRFLHQPLTFHRQAKKAAIASAAAQRQGKFWAYHDKLFANQRALKVPQLIQYARELAAADPAFKFDKWQRDFKDPVLDAFVERNRATANAVGARGTPMFFINGKSVRGAQPYPNFDKIVKAEIAAAGKKRGADWIRKRTQKNNRSLAAYVYEGKQPPASAPPRKRNKRTRKEDLSIYKVSVNTKTDAVKGKKRGALVTLVEFSEYQCPYCSKINPTLTKLLTTYKGQIRLIFKHNPLSFHKQAMGASEASLCAKDQGKFWDMHDVLFANQRKLKPENLEQYATDLKLDLDKFKKCMSSHKYRAQILADQALAGKVTARGTPNVFINGRKVRGARPYADFKKIVDEQLAKAKTLLAKGVPADRIYDTLIAKGKIREPLASKVVKLGVGNSARIGPANAPIQIIEFSDFQCPFCARVSKPLKAVQKHYGKKAVLVFKNFPLRMHKEARPAAIASLCAKQQGKFWQYHDYLFAKFRELRGATQEKFVGFAKIVGVGNIAKFTKCLTSPEAAKQVDSEFAEGRRAGVSGTPSIYINGRKFSPMGAGYTLKAMTAIIDREILKKK